MFQLLLLALYNQHVCAGVITAAESVITPAPLLPRDVTTAGYRSTDETDGTTLWGTVTYNLEDMILATSGSLYRICSQTCDFFTCDAGYMVYSTTSAYCGAEYGSTCSYDVSYTDMSDSDPMTNYWCDTNTLEGWTIYGATPADDATTIPSDTATVGNFNAPTATSTSSASTSTSPAPPPTPLPDNKGKSKPIGAIVGGVIGGIAVLGIIIVAAVVIILRRNKRTPPPQPPPVQQVQQYPPPQQHQQYPPQQHQQYPPPQQHQQYYDPAVAPLPEKTPAATTMNVNPYYTNGGSGPASPVPQYTPNNGAMNELPAMRM